MDTLYPYPSLNRLFFFIHNIIDICFLINVFFLHISLGGDHPKCVRLPQLPRPPPTAQTHARWVNIVFSIGSRCRCECDRLVTRPGWSLPPTPWQLGGAPAPHALTLNRRNWMCGKTDSSRNTCLSWLSCFMTYFIIVTFKSIFFFCLCAARVVGRIDLHRRQLWWSITNHMLL